MDLEAKLKEEGYSCLQRRDDGKWYGLKRMMYTTGIFVGLDDFFYEYRYCYRHQIEAAVAIHSWNGHGHPPGNWIVCKGRREGDIQGPGATLPEPDEVTLWQP